MADHEPRILWQLSTKRTRLTNECVRRACRGCLCAGASFGPCARRAAAVDLTGLLDTYYQGRYDEAVAKAAALPELGPFRLQFVQDTPVWVNADPAQRRETARGGRRLPAGTRRRAPRIRLGPLLGSDRVDVRAAARDERAADRVRAGVAHGHHALAGRARGRVWLLGPYARLPHQKPLKRVPQRDDPPSPLHLMHAIERFPDDPQFQLSRVVAWTWGRDAEPIRNMRAGSERSDAHRAAGATRSDHRARTADRDAGRGRRGVDPHGPGALQRRRLRWRRCTRSKPRSRSPAARR